VYLLFKMHKGLGYCLLAGYAVAQTIGWTTGILNWVSTTTGTSENLAWTSPVENSALLAYEFVLCGLAVRFAFKNVPRDFWRHPADSTKCIVSIVVRDNFIYFFV